MDNNTILIIAVLFGGFIAVTAMAQLLGRSFSWHAELD
jgi:hypothetical protein